MGKSESDFQIHYLTSGYFPVYKGSYQGDLILHSWWCYRGNWCAKQAWCALWSKHTWLFLHPLNLIPKGRDGKRGRGWFPKPVSDKSHRPRPILFTLSWHLEATNTAAIQQWHSPVLLNDPELWMGPSFLSSLSKLRPASMNSGSDFALWPWRWGRTSEKPFQRPAGPSKPSSPSLRLKGDTPLSLWIFSQSFIISNQIRIDKTSSPSFPL